jgi:hypothetical protein
MSRDKLDRYYTPDALALAIVSALRDEVGAARWRTLRTVTEPSVGGGAFVMALNGLLWHREDVIVKAIDRDHTARGLVFADRPMIGDFLGRTNGEVGADLIVGNPPYSDAEAHIRASLERAPLVCLLLRASILGGQARHALWREHPPRRVWSVVGRPSFTAGGTDSSEYVVVLWDRYWTNDPRLGWLTWRDGGTDGA